MRREHVASALRKLTRGRAVRFVSVVGALILINEVAGANSLLQQPVIRTYQPVRIALPEFVAESPADAGAGQMIAQIIAGNLELTNVFVLIDPATFSERSVGVDATPAFADWRASRTHELVVGSITRLPDGRVRIAFRLWDIFGERQLAGKQYLGNPDDVREIGGIISAAIYDRVVDRNR
jgi:TolB protein